MMSVFLASCVFFSLCKNSFFLSSFFFLEKNIIPLIFLFFPVSYLIKQCFHSLSSPSLSLMYFTSFNILFFFLSLCFCSCFAFSFLMTLECCVFIMILLIFNMSKDYDKFSSVCFMVVINMLGSIPFMVFVGLDFLSCPLLSYKNILVLFGCYFILFSKIPIYFMHFWLTKAHVSAMGSGSMMLASLMLKIGTIGLFKFAPMFLMFCSGDLMTLFSSLSSVSFLVIAVVMTRFFDVKYMVACSSILHMGIILPCCNLYMASGIISSLFMMVGHGLVSCFIFYLVTVMYEGSLNRSSDSGKGAESIGSSFSLILFTFFLFNLGFPPLMSFLSEFFFISMLWSISIPMLGMFSISLIISGIVFMFFLLILLFNKNAKKMSGVSDYCLISFYFWYVFLFLIMPLMFC